MFVSLRAPLSAQFLKYTAQVPTTRDDYITNVGFVCPSLNRQVFAARRRVNLVNCSIYATEINSLTETVSFN